jgi:hypothetical protein
MPQFKRFSLLEVLRLGLLALKMALLKLLPLAACRQRELINTGKEYGTRRTCLSTLASKAKSCAPNPIFAVWHAKGFVPVLRPESILVRVRPAHRTATALSIRALVLLLVVLAKQKYATTTTSAQPTHATRLVAACSLRHLDHVDPDKLV